MLRAEQLPRRLLVSTVLALTACGGGGGASAPAPSPPASPSPGITPSPSPSPTTVCGAGFLGTATVTFTGVCNGACTNTRPADAIDNKADTAAEMSFTGVQGTFTLQATTQPGTVVPAGQRAGALLSQVADAAVSTTVTINTFLDGTMQETVGSTSSTASPSTTATPTFVRFANSKPYNRIDVVLERTGNVSARIFEVCSE